MTIASDTRRTAQILSTLSTLAGLFLATSLAVVALSGRNPTVIFLAFLMAMLIGPLLGALIVEDMPRTALLAAKALLLAGAVILVLSILLQSFGVSSSGAWMSAVVAVMSLAAMQWRRGRDAFSDIGRLDAGTTIAVAIAVALLSPFEPAESIPVGFLKYALSAPLFGVWLALGFAWLAVGVGLRRYESWAFPRARRLFEVAAVVVGCAAIVLLYDDGHFVDVAHYQPLVGPALHAMHGGVPMVDSYSQYGLLPWLVVRAAYSFFEPSFGTAAVVVRAVNIAYFLVLLSILLCASRRPVSALWFLIPAVIVALTSHNPGPYGMWNLNALPMTLGGRWLVPSLMTLLLVIGRNQPWARWAGLALIMVASVASFDILAFTLAPWGYCLLLDSVRTRSLRLLLSRGLLAVLAIALAQALLIASVFFSSGSLVDYRPYFDQALQNRPVEDSYWSAALNPYYALWLPICLTYFLVLGAGAYRALRRQPSEGLLERLLPMAVMGLGPLAYFFGRPQEATLNIACLTFAVVAIALAQPLFAAPERLGLAGKVLAATLAVAFAFSIADGFEHFMRPIDPGRGNATVLRRCLTSDGCRLQEVPRNIALALHTPTLDLRTQVAAYARDATPQVDEAIALLRRVAPRDPFVGMIVDTVDIRYANASGAIGMIAFMTTGQWYAWDISSAINDDKSPVVTGRILRRVADTPSGFPIIIINQREALLPLNQAILKVLNARCDLKLVEAGRYLSAYVTERCSGATGNPR